ncbi:Aste57867_11813 [Aphanomyces stellatus]|uniref:Aste57867_11813 protein n=1 Tax=Aphanomyces stellatus TaxID=120398 RepID=A0A485KVX6_9STRA|nr:hypothetical protein As57867_011768 [Aphanomyces stellatus]VFT88668.1 Aste57867_11813 [Aphanomyces stellatus]
MSDSEGDNSPAISDSEEEVVNETKKRKQPSKDGKSKKKKSRVMNDSDDESSKKKSKLVDDEASESDEDKVVDSSEEELDEDADAYEKDGFLVGDDEDDDEEDDEPRRRRKKKDKKEKKRSRLRHGRDNDDELDRDDLDLIQENLGIKKPRARAYSDDEDDDFISDDGGSPQRKKKSKGSVDKDLSKRMFGSDSEDDDDRGGGSSRRAQQDQYMDEQDYNSEEDFIVSDDDERGRGGRSKRPVKKRTQMGNLPQGPSLYQLDEAEELFGDTDAFLEATRGAVPATTGDSETEKHAMLLDKYEPSVLKEFHMTSTDAAIRERDEPERYQFIFRHRVFPDAEERAEEAEWMVDNVLKKLEAKDPTKHVARGDVVTAIDHVLRFYHDEKLEPAYVQRYCKEYWKQAGLHSDELYLIQDLDLKWDKLDRKRKALQKYIEKAVLANDTTESTTVRSCYQQVLRQTEDKGLVDISQAFSTLNVQDKPDKDKKRPGRRTLYQLCLKGGLKDLVSQFTVNAAILGGCLMGLVPDAQVQVPTPQVALAETLMPYLSVDFPSVNDVLKGARHVAATHLATDPNVRARMRELCLRHAVVFTDATLKGVDEIDEFHFCHGLQYIKEMPVSELLDKDLYMKLVKGEKEGVLTVHFQIEHQHLIEPLEVSYLDPKHSSDEWQSQRREIIREAVGAFLVPSLLEEIKAELLQSSQDVVLARCSRAMKDRLMVRPFESKDGLEPQIMGVFVDNTVDEPIANIVALDENGELADKALGRCKTAACLATLTGILTRFLEDHPKISAVVLNTSGGAKSMDVGELVDVVRNKIRRQAHNDPDYLHVTFLKDDVPRMFAKSKRAETEFPEEEDGIRSAIGLARYLRNPLSEMCAIWGSAPLQEPGRGKELLYLTVDPLQQMVNQEMLLRAYERVFIQVVNKVGIDINVAANYSHASYALQFVCGLGPVKAMALIEKIRIMGHVEKRQDLQKILSDKVVYKNCAGVLRIRERDALKEAALNPLDDTRIHPESYYMAVKMCGDANNNTTMDLWDPDQYSYAVEDTMFQSATAIKAATQKYHPEPFQRLHDAEIADSLADLDLPAYAQRLEMQQKGPKLHTLESIKQELRYPYFDTRQKYKDPMLEDLFFLLHGETRETLRVGMVVPCKLIKTAGDSNVIVELHSGIRAQLKKENLPTFITRDGNQYLRANGFPRGMQVNAKIMDIIPDGDRYVLSLACDDRSILTMTEECFNRRSIPSWTDVERVIDDSKSRYDKLVNKLPSVDKEKDWNNLKAVNGPVRKKRQIAHPAFKNVSMKQCLALMKEMHQGDVMLRPASKGSDHLNLTWKVTDNVLRHFDVEEKDKPTEGRLGAKLIVKKEEYDSIDELIARLIDPMNVYVEEITSHEKYKTGDVHAIGEELVEQKTANPQSVPWALHVYLRFPGCFSITYVARTTPRTFHFEVKPTGLRFFGELSCAVPITSLNKAIAFFKKSASNPPKRPVARAPSSQYSAAPPAPHGGGSSYNTAPPSYGSYPSRDRPTYDNRAPYQNPPPGGAYYDQNRNRNNFDQGRPRDDRRY